MLTYVNIFFDLAHRAELERYGIFVVLIFPKKITMTSTSTNKTKGWNIGLWVAQGLMAAMFIMAGFMKLSQPIAELAGTLPWVKEAPEMLVRFIGLSELLGGVGLLLPTALRIKPGLTNLAAIGLCIIMFLALAFHISRGEYEAVPVNVVIGAILGFIIWGRNKKAPILPE